MGVLHCVHIGNQALVVIFQSLQPVVLLLSFHFQFVNCVLELQTFQVLLLDVFFSDLAAPALDEVAYFSELIVVLVLVGVVLLQIVPGDEMLQAGDFLLVFQAEFLEFVDFLPQVFFVPVVLEQFLVLLLPLMAPGSDEVGVLQFGVHPAQAGALVDVADVLEGFETFSRPWREEVGGSVVFGFGSFQSLT